MSLVSEQDEHQKRRLIEVRYYLTPEEYTNVEQTAFHMYQEGLIPKGNVNSFAKAAGFKFYNEYNDMLRRSLNANH